MSVLQHGHAEGLALFSHACDCATHILQSYVGISVAKAMRLDTPGEFDRAVARLALALRRQAQEPEQQAVKAALDRLDVDWSRTTAEQRRELLSRARKVAGRAVEGVPQTLRETLSEAAADVFGAARNHGRELGLAIGSVFTALDHRMMTFMTRSHVLFVRDAYGRRVEAFSERARAVVADGMAAGLGRDDLASDLADAAAQTLLERGRSYWELVASAFVGRGRSCAQVGAYAEAGITHYRVEAVLDERTSSICRLLHGRVVAVRDALHSLDAADRLSDPEAIKNLTPWPREDAGGLYIMRYGKRRDIARTSAPALGELGLAFPPYHGLCRTTTVAVSHTQRVSAP